jgi:hypothetical protein
VLEHEATALQQLEDSRLGDVLEQVAVLRAEIIATLGELRRGLETNGDSAAT